MITTLTTLLLSAAAAAGALPPAKAGQCAWVHGRFAVHNGSSIQRIWIIGTRRIVALRDDDKSIPSEIRRYEAAGPHTDLADALFGDFHICALEPSRKGRMQHVRLTAAKNLKFRNKPFI